MLVRNEMNTISPEMIEKKGALESIATCDLCGGSEFAPELRIDEWLIVKCKNCRLAFTSPRYSREYIRNLYQNTYYERASQYLLMQLGKTPPEILQFPSQVMEILCTAGGGKGLRSLDVGCGGGMVVAAFKKAGWEALGIDLNQRAIDAGRELGLDLRAMDFEGTSIGIGKFDAITAFHILEHAASPKAFLQRCSDLLNIGSVLAVEVPDFACRDFSQMRQFWPHLYPHLHLYQFTKDTLIRYLVQAGFEIVKVNKIHGRGPLEYRTPPQNGNTAQGRIKDMFFECRHLVYWIPKVRDIARYLIWETLGYGQFLRVIARKNRCLGGGK